MIATFYLAGAVAVLSTAMVITSVEAVHALLYLIVSLLAVAVVFFTLGAPFVAALEVIVYAGAIMVLFVFVVMMLNLAVSGAALERRRIHSTGWIGPTILLVVLLAELAYALWSGGGPSAPRIVVGPREVGGALFGRYVLVVELASLLLLAGLIGACHLGRRPPRSGGTA